MHDNSRGLSLIELMVSISVALAVTSAVLALALSSKSLYETDKTRTRLNQNLRASQAFLVTDVRQAGERLGEDFPAIILTRGEDLPGGGTGDPDRLQLRRNLIDTVMPVCEDVTGVGVKIAKTASPPPGCTPLPDDDGDGWPDNLEVWRDYRQAQGGAVHAYIYNPVTGNGEFFTYDSEDHTLLEIRAASGTTWDYSYPATDQSRVYILEERRYELDGRLLRVVINEDTAGAVHLVDDIEDFQVVALFRDGSQQDSLDASDLWSDLKSLDLGVLSRVYQRNDVTEEWMRVQVMPRNVLSN